MSRSPLLRYALLCGLIGIPVSVFANLLLPVILESRLLFGALIALLLMCGLVTAAGATREVFRR